MTRRRQKHFLIGLLAVSTLGLCLLGSAPALAAEEKPPAGASSSKAPARPWLRGENKPAPVASAPNSPSAGRMALICGLVALLAGAAFFMKRRRRVNIARSSSELSVMTAARVGNKADVVVVSIGGRRLLLGVTESQVSRLCWLDGEPDPEEFAALEPRVPMNVPAPADRRAAAAAAFSHKPVQRAHAAPGARGFRDVLRSALGRSAPLEDPALAIAAATEDVITRSASSRIATPAGAPEMVDVEGQARGLVLRLQKRG